MGKNKSIKYDELLKRTQLEDKLLKDFLEDNLFYKKYDKHVDKNDIVKL